MDLFLNELSLEGQFRTPEEVLAALDGVMRMRECARHHKRKIRVAASLGDRTAAPGFSFREIIWRTRDMNVRRAVLAWMDREGPFLEEDRLAGGGEDVVHAGRSVTTSSVAEAVCRVAIGSEAALTGFSPSTFDAHPLVLELRESERVSRIEVENYWTRDKLDRRLRELQHPIGSWVDFDRAVRLDFPELVFGKDCVQLEGHPFNPGVAERIRKLLNMLAEMRRSISPDGSHGERWHELWKRWFAGGELFSDSSESEKNQFDKQLTFEHPAAPSLRLKCPWHGKVNKPKIRVHFSFPITVQTPVYIVYVGPKITRR
jgi:hypothetical protein